VPGIQEDLHLVLVFLTVPFGVGDLYHITLTSTRSSSGLAANARQMIPCHATRFDTSPLTDGDAQQTIFIACAGDQTIV
jgi:hypothetical protein